MHDHHILQHVHVQNEVNVSCEEPEILVTSYISTVKLARCDGCAVTEGIDFLKASISPNDQNGLNDAASANAALQQLTHRYVERSETGAWVDAARQRWQRWWLTSGRDAKTYLPGECVPDIELP
jgi:hypothetical protein